MNLLIRVSSTGKGTQPRLSSVSWQARMSNFAPTLGRQALRHAPSPSGLPEPIEVAVRGRCGGRQQGFSEWQKEAHGHA
ncbi:MAG: hypothetical protein JWN21_670 [Sphingomonas bacterium]|uniref:hypothetical protein n=1 Tax=Sphingomonas bacterium TaxID=1895847 RepID=UPI00261F46B6|nr:hypothetical protein [Sphingomonas bacterium]MDB5695127.1 hypothetical protein [Sphingomonas bacterium]